jgi:hypothetical protein
MATTGESGTHDHSAHGTIAFINPWLWKQPKPDASNTVIVS